MMISGSKPATLRDLRLVDIHGTRFYDLAFAHDDAPDRVLTARVGVEDAYNDPKPGDLIAVRYVMNVVVGVTKRG